MFIAFYFLIFSNAFTLCILEDNEIDITKCDKTVNSFDIKNYESDCRFDYLIISKTRRAITIPMNILANNVTVETINNTKTLTFNAPKLMETYPTFYFKQQQNPVVFSGILPIIYPQIYGLNEQPTFKYLRMIINVSCSIIETSQNCFDFEAENDLTFDGTNKEIKNITLLSPAFLLLNNVNITISSLLKESASKITIETIQDSHCFVSSSLPIDEISLGKGSHLTLDEKTQLSSMASITIAFSYDHLSFLDIQKPIVDIETPFILVNYIEDFGSQRFLPLYKIAHISIPNEWMQIKVIRNGGSWNKQKIDYDFNLKYSESNLYVELKHEIVYLEDQFNSTTNIRFITLNSTLTTLNLNQISGGLHIEGKGSLKLIGQSSQIPKITIAENSINDIKVIFEGSLAYDGFSHIESSKYDITTNIQSLIVITHSNTHITILSNNSLKINCNNVDSFFTFKDSINIDCYGNDYIEIEGKQSNVLINELSLKDKAIKIMNVIISNLLIYSGTDVILDYNVSFMNNGIIAMNYHALYPSSLILYEEIQQKPSQIIISYNRKDDYSSKEEQEECPHKTEIIYGFINGFGELITTKLFYFDYSIDLYKAEMEKDNTSISFIYQKQKQQIIKLNKICYNPFDNQTNSKCPSGFTIVPSLSRVFNIKELYLLDHSFIQENQLAEKMALKVSAPSNNEIEDPILKKQNIWLSLMSDKEITKLEVQNICLYAYTSRGKYIPIKRTISSSKNVLYCDIKEFLINENSHLTIVPEISFEGNEINIIKENATLTMVNSHRNLPKSIRIIGSFDLNKPVIKGANKDLIKKISRPIKIEVDYNNDISIYVIDNPNKNDYDSISSNIKEEI